LERFAYQLYFDKYIIGDKTMFSNMIKKSVIKSQHCQRNWDLTKTIPQEDIDVLETAITECPSKQNIVFYTPYMIQDRNTIEKIHACTDGFLRIEDGVTETNSQTLANLLIAFVQDSHYQKRASRNTQTDDLNNKENKDVLHNDKMLSVGIAAGYCNLTATMLGYSTGCCTCFDGQKVADILGTNEKVLLLMGVGYPDDSRSRREHHKNSGFVFPTLSKDLNARHI
jgi:nitroreductase